MQILPRDEYVEMVAAVVQQVIMHPAFSEQFAELEATVTRRDAFWPEIYALTWAVAYGAHRTRSENKDRSDELLDDAITLFVRHTAVSGTPQSLHSELENILKRRIAEYVVALRSDEPQIAMLRLYQAATGDEDDPFERMMLCAMLVPLAEAFKESFSQIKLRPAPAAMAGAVERVPHSTGRIIRLLHKVRLPWRRTCYFLSALFAWGITSSSDAVTTRSGAILTSIVFFFLLFLILYGPIGFILWLSEQPRHGPKELNR